MVNMVVPSHEIMDAERLQVTMQQQHMPVNVAITPTRPREICWTQLHLRSQ